MSKQKSECAYSPEIVRLTAKKEHLFAIIQDAYTLSKDISDETNKEQFLIMIQSLEKTRTDFMQTLDDLAIAQISFDPKSKPDYSSMKSFDQLYCHIKACENKYNCKISRCDQKFELLNKKLPPLNLISFDGTPTKWSLFYENFKSLIHENPRLTDAEKVQYLVGKLTGKALTVCSGIPPTSDNYLIIWNALLEKYQDIRVQASFYIDQMINFKTGQSLDTFLEQFCSAESALRRLKIDNLSDYIFTHIALNKLDKETQRHHSLLHMHDTQSAITPSSHKATSVSYPSHSHAPYSAPVADTLTQSNSMQQVHADSNTRANLNNVALSVVTSSRCNELDCGSMSHFITKSCCDRLNLKITPASSSIKGIGQTESVSYGVTTLKFHSRFDPMCSYDIVARVIDSITDHLPNYELDISKLTHFSDLPMADYNYHTPGEVDCLIGNELFPFLLGSDKVTSPHSSVVALETTLGYVAMGKAAVTRIKPCRNANNKTFFCFTEQTSTLESITQRFWELDNVPHKTHMSPDDQACEEIFKSTYSRDSTGRYTVHLPFKHNPSELGNSHFIAKRRLLNLEKKLDSNPDLRTNYNDTLQSYIDKGYLSKVENASSDDSSYYIPHRAVYRPDKLTSKTRIVIDASSKTTSGKSLNDLLYTGPNLQTSIFDLLLNLRMFSVALSADIEKMYFQLKLTPTHHAFQRILYRFDSRSDIDTFEFNRVSFGISSSPYLAMRVIRQLAADSRDQFPLAATEAETHMYMDDFITSMDGVDVALKAKSELIQMFASGGFNLTKWISNSPDLLDKSSAMQSEDVIQFDTNASTPHKIVGMQWLPTTDHFQFSTNADMQECTKRFILSITARLFDPLGLLGPVVTYMKLLVQECWMAGLDWDDPVPPAILNKWTQFHNELACLEQIKIPRHVGLRSPHVILLGFADASERCYGANVYIRVSQDSYSPGSVHLLASKSRVASLSKMPLARLELCAALLLANLLDAVRHTLSQRCHINEIYSFSDSSVALTWIHSPPYKFHTFVANRITEINSKLPAKHWFHVKGIENPADIISRPVTPKALVNNQFWFNGPNWLSLSCSDWPLKPFTINPNGCLGNLETKTISLVVQSPEDIQTSHPIEIMAERISNWLKLLRSVVYMLRFIQKLKSQQPISVQDLEFSELYIIRFVQNKHFSKEITALRNGKLSDSSLLKLNPFIDKEGLLRVGGRLSNSELDFGQKHPILLPSKKFNNSIDY
ncbi:uncharacterized protein LOC132904364 [Amyelois transitella]|uniref:uncharacterized protein LOC132904364 n=1 Tax=Amyelois transitella TaxID=680683 RepID=UPI00298FC230|nr:uncharacterized protein LOC132904364 [Amyelois transitella]